MSVLDHLGDRKEKFCAKMREVAEDETQRTYPADIRSLIEIAETDEEVDLAVNLMERLLRSSKEPFQTIYHFGPNYMRMLHLKHRVDQAYKLFTDHKDGVAPWFRNVSSCQLMMDMLYQEERYQDIIDLYYTTEAVFHNLPQNFVTAVFAALYQLNDEDALTHAMYILDKLNIKKINISERSFSYLVMLPLNLKKPDVAMEIMESSSCTGVMSKKFTEKANFKILALTRLQKLHEAVDILKSFLRKHNLEGELMLFSEAIEELETEISKTDDIRFKQSFPDLKRALYRAGLVRPQTFHDYVTGPVYSKSMVVSYNAVGV